MLALALLAACGPDYDLAEVDDAWSDGGAALVEEDASHRVRRERFHVGADETAAVADYLFVVDGSVSMKRVLTAFREGFHSLAGADAFPPKARIAVMSTTPGDPRDLTRPHPAVRAVDLREEPGFLHLVSRERLAAAGERSERAARRYRAPGCDAWFAPGAVDASGTPCIVAHTQLSLAPVGAEAGLTAFAQLLEASDGPVFRPGTAANVVFVSDTHDPGFGRIDRPSRDELLADRPTFADLAALVAEHETVASFRVHAIAPATECGEVWDPTDPAYFTAADEGDGDVLDICTATDYAGFIRGIARSGARVQRPMVPLGRAAATVEDVRVDGRRAAYDVVAGGRALELRGVVPAGHVDLDVTYRY